MKKVWYVEHGQMAGWGLVWAKHPHVPFCDSVEELRQEVAKWRAESENWAVELKARSKLIYEEE